MVLDMLKEIKEILNEVEAEQNIRSGLLSNIYDLERKFVHLEERNRAQEQMALIVKQAALGE